MSNTGLGKSLSELYELYCENGGVVTTDSRAVRELAAPIFFALKGENFDGNDYAVQAIADGACAAVVHDRLPKGIKPASTEAAKYFVVKDTLAALQELAAYHRQMLGLPVIALTGSNGKTTTKELIARVLGTKYRVASTRGNLNNHIGVPLTLLSITEEDDVAIVEMGANHRGEIAALCEIAAPNIGLITNVGRAHLEGFGGPEGVRLGKGELYDYLAAHGGTALYATDDPVLAELVAERFTTDSPAMSVGYSALAFGLSATGGDLLTLDTAEGEVQTHLAGTYNLANVAAAVAAGAYFGIPTDAALAAVAAYVPDNNRSQVSRSANGTGNTLYKDAYNANPSSMRAAVDNFLALPDDGFEGGKILILGDMRELGNFSREEHRAIIDRIAETAATRSAALTCYVVGPEFSAALAASNASRDRKPLIIRAFANVTEWMAAVANGEIVIRNAQVLVKGSRGMTLEKLYPLL
ncbi:UDP-N-acetylmuramoyl-tripeptide--D-alanyl-D-alanine ligase [uncultured Rikenella sp.]|uniref:UDP-N-acetylmuramoyl-tripeptide--D-alanyl-D- alanine ligase n=1 Tax=uncultured Rikenella sp. TaxID=368003 RepID=UPI00272C511D|nr:UDP-N-acetylmuramoyl-tripeptide--D-alanyl-D-alanine ligase [uncultured Rikenella sp.]